MSGADGRPQIIDPLRERWVRLREGGGEAERPRITAIGIGSGPGDVADNVGRHLSESGFGVE